MKFQKSLISVILFTSLLPAVAFASEFCDGFEEGYKTGYKQAKQSGMDPMVPMCPMQPMKGFGDPPSDFEHGYTVGFRKGVAEGSK
jgi:hypothetical protein